MKRLRMAAIAAFAIFSLALAGCQDTGTDSAGGSLDIPVSIPASMGEDMTSPSAAP